MAECFKCNGICTQKEDKNALFGFPCDLCQRVVCKNCTGLMASEIRVVPSQSRTLFYICPDCKNSFTEIPKLAKRITSLESEVKTWKQKFSNEKKLWETEVGKIKASFEKEMLQCTSNGPSSHVAVVTNTDADNQGGLRDLFRDELKNGLKTQTDLIASQLYNVVDCIKDANKDLVRFLTEKNALISHSAPSVTPPVDPGLAVRAISEALSIGNVNTTMTKNNKQSEEHNSIVNRTQNIIRGTNKNNTILTAAPKQSWFYVGNLDVQSTVEQLIDHLKVNSIPVLTCEKLSSRNRHAVAASFKVSIEPELKTAILNSDIWPENVSIKPFIFPNGGQSLQSHRGHGRGGRFFMKRPHTQNKV